MKKKAKKEELEEQDNTKLEPNEVLEKIAKDEDNEEFEEFSDVNSNHSFKFIRKTIVIIILLIVFFRFYGVSRIFTKEYSIIDEAIPQGFNGAKIVQISDIHFGTTVNEAMLQKIVNKVNELKPDIIVFTGDLIDKGINPTDKIKAEISVNLSKLTANIGKYAIASDEDLNNNDFTTLITNSGFTLLNNESTLIYNNFEEPIELVGLSNPSESVSTTANYKIALIHKPDDTDSILNNNYNLILAGHSHGGIIRLPFIGGLVRLEGAKKYYNDSYILDNTRLYISSGLGTSNINFRMFNQPSINLYRLYKN